MLLEQVDVKQQVDGPARSGVRAISCLGSAAQRRGARLAQVEALQEPLAREVTESLIGAGGGGGGVGQKRLREAPFEVLRGGADVSRPASELCNCCEAEVAAEVIVHLSGGAGKVAFPKDARVVNDTRHRRVASPERFS